MKRRLAVTLAIGLVGLTWTGVGASTPSDRESAEAAFVDWLDEQELEHPLDPIACAVDGETATCFGLQGWMTWMPWVYRGELVDGEWTGWVEIGGDDVDAGEPVEYEGDGIVTEGDGSVEEIEERAVEAIRPNWPADTPELELRRKAQPFVEMCTSDLSDSTNAVSLSVALSSNPEVREILEAACPARIAEFDAGT